MARTIRLTPKKITLILGSIILILLGANLVVVYLHFVRGYKYLKGFIHAFYFDTEANFPSFYSAITIFGAAVLLWSIGTLNQEKSAGRSAYWKFLAFIFAFLAVDEFASLHEMLIEPVKAIIDSSWIESDLLYFAWFLPYGMGVLVLALVYFRFFVRLPGRIRLLFLMAAGLFLFGAIVLEMFGGRYWALQGWKIDGSDSVDLNYALITTAEELLEMLGILTFNFALLDYYLSNTPPHSLTLTFSNRDQSTITRRS